MILARRQFLHCLTGIVAAPAVVKADALMKVFAPKYPKWWTIADATPEEIKLFTQLPIADMFDFDAALRQYAESIGIPKYYLLPRLTAAKYSV